MNQDLSYTILKYVMLIIVLYALFKSFANTQMNDTDLLYIIVISVVVYAIIKNLYDAYILLPFNPNTFMREHLDNIPAPQPKTELELRDEAEKKMKEVEAENLKIEVRRKAQESANILNTSKDIVRNPDGSYSIKPVMPETKDTEVISNEMIYNDFNQIPYDDTKAEFEFGYSFIPPKDWFPVPMHPPVCVTTRKSNVCSMPTIGTNVNLKEWHSSRRISQPDNINEKYIKEKLNSGN